MAKLKGSKGTTWGLSGKMRDMVFRETKNGIIAAEYNKRSQPYITSNKQKEVNAKFSTLSKMAGPLSDALKIGFKNYMVKTYIGNPIFIKENFEFAKYDSFKKEVTVDYQKIIVSKGKLPLLTPKRGVAPECDANLNLTLAWDADLYTGDDSDRIVLCVYCENVQNGTPAGLVSIGKVTALDGLISVKLYSDWIDNNIHIYAFTTNGKDVSSSSYLGSAVVEI